MKTKVSFFEIVLTILLIPAIIYGLSISIDSSLYTNLSMAADDNGRVILKGFAYLLSFACLALPSLALYCFKTAIEQLQSNIAVTIKTLLVGVFCWWLWYNYAWPLQLIGYMGVQAQQNKLLEAGSTEAQNHRINEQAAISAYNSQIATLNASRDAALARISACKSYGSNKTTAKQNCINDANKGLQVIANSLASLKQPQLTSTANLAASSKHALFPAITTLKELDSVEAHILSDFSKTNAETSQVKYFSANAFSLESFNSILMFVLMVIWSKKGRLIDNVNTGIDSDVADALEFRDHNAPRPTIQQTANNLAESFRSRYLNNQAPIANETRAEIQSPILPFDNPQPYNRVATNTHSFRPNASENIPSELEPANSNITFGFIPQSNTSTNSNNNHVHNNRARIDTPAPDTATVAQVNTESHESVLMPAIPMTAANTDTPSNSRTRSQNSNGRGRASNVSLRDLIADIATGKFQQTQADIVNNQNKISQNAIKNYCKVRTQRAQRIMRGLRLAKVIDAHHKIIIEVKNHEK